MKLIKKIIAYRTKIITVIGLVMGVYGASVCLGDDIEHIRNKRNNAYPWVNIMKGIELIEDYDRGIQGVNNMATGAIYRNEIGFYEILEVIRKNKDIQNYNNVEAIYTQIRGQSIKVASKFRWGPIYFGIHWESSEDELIGEYSFLKNWIFECRKEFYIKQGLLWILLGFGFQLIAALIKK